jgi:hypothetical protein
MGCYYCGKEQTSVEHIPPKSFFPKNQRKNLLTVPSCDEHNQQKSTDDEYVKAILLSSILANGNSNLVDLRETLERSLHRSGKRMVENVTSKEQAKKFIDVAENFANDPIGGAKAFDYLRKNGIVKTGLLGLINDDVLPEIIYDKHGNEIITTSIKFDYERVMRFFESLARGLYFHKLRHPWQGRVYILPHFLLKLDALEKDKQKSEFYLQHLKKDEAEGENKGIFYFDGFNSINPNTNEVDEYFFNYCIFDTFKITAVFRL